MNLEGLTIVDMRETSSKSRGGSGVGNARSPHMPEFRVSVGTH